jgi:4-amino-4-deoxy-L-arabinose transferase-like glycosyltransferase
MTLRQRLDEFSARSWQPIVLLFVVAAAIRLSIALWLPAQIIWEDGYRYRTVADNLLSGRGFGSLVDNAASVPTQPLLLAAVDLLLPGGQRAERIFFALLGSVTCVLGYVLAKRLFGPRPALLAGSVLCIYPHLAYCSALFEYPQTFFIFVMSVVFLLLYEFIDSRRKSRLFLCGLCLGLGILTVPTVLIFVPLLTVSLWREGVREAALRSLVLLLAVAIPVGSWAVRNYHAYGQFVLVNEAGGRNFWFANNESYYLFGKAGTVPACNPQYGVTEFCRQFKELGIHVGDGGLTPQQIVFAYERGSWSNGWKFVRESPGHFIELMGSKFLQYWSPIPDAVTQGREQGGAGRTWIAAASYLPVLVCAVFGFALSASQWQRLLPIYLYFLAFIAVHSVFLPTLRYRLQLDFFLIIFAGYAVARSLAPSRSANRLSTAP